MGAGVRPQIAPAWGKSSPEFGELAPCPEVWGLRHRRCLDWLSVNYHRRGLERVTSTLGYLADDNGRYDNHAVRGLRLTDSLAPSGVMASTAARQSEAAALMVAAGSGEWGGGDEQRAAVTQVPVLAPASVARIAGAVASAWAPNTTRAYRADWERFTAWCDRWAYAPLPVHPLVLADYLTEHAAQVVTGPRPASPRGGGGERRRYAVSTLSRWVASVNARHTAAGYLPPGQHELVRTTLAGLRRAYAAEGSRPVRRRAPLLTEDLRLLLADAREAAGSWVAQIAERRDSALLLFGQPGAFRRSELVALNLADIAVEDGYGLFVAVRRSKTDQVGEGLVKALPFGGDYQSCPACAYARWREVLDAWDLAGRAAAIRALRDSPPFTGHVHHLIDVPDRADRAADGQRAAGGGVALFRGVHRTGAISPSRLSAQAVNPILARRAAAAGLPASVLELLGGHSLRAGFVTQAKANGAADEEIMRQTGHTSAAMVRAYTRHPLPQQGNAVARLGL